MPHLPAKLVLQVEARDPGNRAQLAKAHALIEMGVDVRKHVSEISALRLLSLRHRSALCSAR